MKKILMCMALAGCLLVSCSKDESLEKGLAPSTTAEAKEQGVVVPKVDLTNLSPKEMELYKKIKRLGSREFQYELDHYSGEQLEEFAIGFIKDDCNAVLLENGYTADRLKSDFNGSELLMVQNAISVCMGKINN